MGRRALWVRLVGDGDLRKPRPWPDPCPARDVRGRRNPGEPADRLRRRAGPGRAQAQPAATRGIRLAAASLKERRRRASKQSLPMKSSVSSPAPPGTAASESAHQALSAYIRARFDEFSRSQKDVAQYIVDHLDEAAFQTAEELARRASTSSSTVVRFSQALGFDGFPELQQAARDEYRRRRPDGASTLSGATPLFSLDQTEFEAVLAADHVNVEDTAQKLSRHTVERGIDAIVSSENVSIASTDQMAFFASYLRHLLMLLDLRAEIVASPSQEALGRLSR